MGHDKDEAQPGEDLVPLLIDLGDQLRVTEFLVRATERLGDRIRVNPWWTERTATDGIENPLLNAGVVVAWVARSAVDTLIPDPGGKPGSPPHTYLNLAADSPGLEVAIGATLGLQPRTATDAAVDPLAGLTPSPAQAGAAEAVIGIIDDGIAFAHRRFRRRIDGPAGPEWQPRIAWFWDQEQTGALAASSPGVPFGAEWSGTGPANGVAGTLTSLLSQATHAGLIDEDEVYRRAQQRQVAQAARHGTHVLDLAAGAEPDEDGPAIVAVQLPASIASRPGHPGVQWNILDGLAYIVWRALAMPRKSNGSRRPIVVNISYGIFDGPHDGTLLLERAMDKLVTACAQAGPLAIVLAAGNHAQTRCRARIDAIPPGETRSLRWSIPPDSDRAARCELWFDAGSRIGVQLSAPDGVAAWSAGAPAGLQAAVRVDPPGSSATARTRAHLEVMPTARVQAGGIIAPAGLWTIAITNRETSPLGVDAWIGRNDTPFGFRGQSRQSHFSDPACPRVDAQGRWLEEDPPTGAPPAAPGVPANPAAVRREGTLSGFATGHTTIVVGAARREAVGGLSPTAYTSQGFAKGRTPDLIARGDHSLSQPGILGAGTRSGSVVCLNGTSVAAPAVTRALAQRLSQPGGLTVAAALAAITDALPSTAIRTGGKTLRSSPVRPEAMR
jgi:hypothetical protein